MSRLVMWNMITLDGRFQGANDWDLDWHETVWGDQLESLSLQQLHAADRLLFGRVTYQGMADYWSSATGEIAELMNALPKFVFSRTLERADWNNTTLVSDDAVAAVSELKTQGDGLTLLFGSANFAATLIEAELFDEYRLAIAPLTLGTGRPLFADGARPLSLQLLNSEPLDTGCVIVRYLPARSSVAG